MCIKIKSIDVASRKKTKNHQNEKNEEGKKIEPKNRFCCVCKYVQENNKRKGQNLRFFFRLFFLENSHSGNIFAQQISEKINRNQHRLQHSKEF